jgi:hypothetical protein
MSESNDTAVENISEELGIEASISEDTSEPAENVISSPKRKSNKRSSVKSVQDNVIGSPSAEANFNEPNKKVEKTGKVTTAIHSSKNVHWEGVGKVHKGFNIVSHEEAEKWLTRKHIRIATPEEVAEEYGF